jgi:hypothetical protein
MPKYFIFFILILFQIHSFSQNFLNSGVVTNNSPNSLSNTIDKESNEFLVVFKSPCLLQRYRENGNLKSATILQPIKDEHDRFISDLSAIRKIDSNDLKSGSIPVIKQEFYRIINAIIIESNGEESSKIKSLDYVETVIKNEKINIVRETESDNKLVAASKIIGEPNSEDGKGIKVGILDTGIDYKNSALGGGFGSGFKVAGGFDFVNNDKDPMDDDGHGTAVAGVIAADGELIGIAPKATLYAYKVMNAWGWGYSNNAFKALEYCVDPNQDLDISDHLDVINMSIATYYGSNELMKTFGDIFEKIANLKMVVCVAAGNEGPNYLLFNSLAVSEHVLSVGSCNSDNNISTFSSRAFGINNYGIKPDIVALGENVQILSLLNSTYRNGGTSIATPGVAGVAALLKQKNKDWTYNQIKSTLMNSTDDLGFNVMEQGAGRVNQGAALGQTTVIFPQTINWGIASEKSGIITKTCTINISNKSQVQQIYTYDFGKNLPSGIVITSDFPSVAINPNESGSILFNFTIDQSQLKYPDQIPFNYYGRIGIYGTKDYVSIPWTLLRGCDVKILSDIKFSTYDAQILKILKNGKQFNPNAFYDPSNVIIVPPGKYDILFKANEGNFRPWLPDTLKGYLYIKENVDISGSVNLDLSKAVIKNRINIQSVDGDGNPLSGLKLLKNMAAFKPFPTSSDFIGIKSKFSTLEPVIFNCGYDKYYINDFEVSNNYKLIVGDYKAIIGEKSDFFVLNYEVEQEIRDHLILKNQSSSLIPYTFIFYPLPNMKSNYSISSGTSWSGNGNIEIPLNETTKSTLWIDKKKEDLFDLSAFPVLLAKDSSDRFEGVRMFGHIYSYGDSIQIKSLRSSFSGYREVFQTINKDDSIFVNNGPAYYSLNITSRYNYKYFGCYSYLKGMYGESCDYGFSNSSISIFDPNDKVVYHGKVGEYNNNPFTGSLDRVKIELSTSDYFINGKQGKALLKYELKGNPPDLFTSIHSMQFLNQRNQIRSEFKIGSSARMSLAVNNAGNTNSIKIYFKLSDETEWKERSISLKKNQFDENIIDTDISDLLTKSIGLDFKIEAIDAAGNKMIYTLKPAIGIGDYHENHDFKVNKMPDITALKNTIVKRKVQFDAFFPEFHFFNWSSKVINGSGTVKFSNDSVYIIPSNDFTGKLTVQIKGVDGQEKDSISVTVFFNELINASFYVNPEYKNGELIGQIGTKYLQKNIHYFLSDDSLSLFSLDSLSGKLYVRDNAYINYQDRRQINLKVIGSNGIEKDTAQITVFIKTKPDASNSTFEITEEEPVGAIVGILKAIDKDGDALSYCILSGNEDEIFIVDKSSGVLLINNDKGLIGHKSFALNWQVSDGIFADQAIASINVSNPTFVGEENSKNIIFYPNPTKGILYLENILDETEIDVLNLNGNKLIGISLNPHSDQKKLDLTHISTGAYILKISNKHNTKSYKLIKL